MSTYVFISLCAELGVPLASDKLEGLSMFLTFLGIILDTEHMEIRLPADKLRSYDPATLDNMASQEKAKKWQIYC